MGKNQMANILTKADKDASKTSGANGVLSRLFRKLLAQANINENRWNDFMRNFLNDPRNGVPNTKKDQTSMRGNLTKEFARPQMTWKVFCKAMIFMQFEQFEVCVIARKPGGQEIAFSTEVYLGKRGDTSQLELFDIDTGDK